MWPSLSGLMVLLRTNQLTRFPGAGQRPHPLPDAGHVRRRAGALEEAQEPVLGRGGVEHEHAAREQDGDTVLVVAGPLHVGSAEQRGESNGSPFKFTEGSNTKGERQRTGLTPLSSVAKPQ